LIGENVGREVAHQLTQRGYHADLVTDVLEPGVADHSEILPYARKHDLVVVTRIVQILARCHRPNMRD